MKKSLLAVSAIISTISIANAQDKFFFKPNIGLDYGISKADINGDLGKVLEDAFNTTGLSLGARVHKNLGFEVNYSKSSKEEKSTNTTQSETSYKSIGVDGIYYAPLLKGIEFFSTAGFAKYDFKVKGPGGKVSENDIAPRLGVGLNYNINDSFALQTSVKHSFVDIKSSEGDINGLNELKVGFRYSF